MKKKASDTEVAELSNSQIFRDFSDYVLFCIDHGILPNTKAQISGVVKTTDHCMNEVFVSVNGLITKLSTEYVSPDRISDDVKTRCLVSVNNIQNGNFAIDFDPACIEDNEPGIAEVDGVQVVIHRRLDNLREYLKGEATAYLSDLKVHSVKAELEKRDMKVAKLEREVLTLRNKNDSLEEKANIEKSKHENVVAKLEAEIIEFRTKHAAMERERDALLSVIDKNSKLVDNALGTKKVESDEKIQATKEQREYQSSKSDETINTLKVIGAVVGATIAIATAIVTVVKMTSKKELMFSACRAVGPSIVKAIVPIGRGIVSSVGRFISNVLFAPFRIFGSFAFG